MKLREILPPDAEIEPRHADLDIGGVTADSRTVKNGDLFVAIAGGKTDGLRFVGAGDRRRRGRHRRGTAAGRAAVRRCRLRARRQCAARAGADRGEVLSAPAAEPSPPSPAPAAKPRSPPSRGKSGRRSAISAASIGTIGIVSPRGETYGSLTTPDPVALHRSLDALAGEGVTHLAIEASSHGLDQYRLDGLRIAAGGFHQYHPRSSRLSSDARGLSRRQAAAVRGAGRTGRGGGHRCRS